MHYSSDELMTQLASDDARHSDSEEWPREALVTLGPDDTSWHPASCRTTARVIAGPCTVRYLQHVDGGIDARVFE